jgi:diguanylate cyclase (GGDEF)-like protein
MSLLATFETMGKPFKVLVAFGLIAAVGFLDLVTGYEVAFSLFYVIPIMLATWSMGRWAGIIASMASALAWVAADWWSGNAYSSAFVPIWNTIIRLSFFLVIALLLSVLRRAMDREKALASTDTLTGAANSRSFRELAQAEIDRFARYQHPFTLAYIDLDNFKGVNDRFGHAAGDRALYTVASFVRDHSRKTDTLARLGGDEFALLLPETSEDVARVVISKIQKGLAEEMQHNGWPVTLSIGVLTCRATPRTSDELIAAADRLMYSVKNGGKDDARYSVYTEDGVADRS